MTRVCLFTDSLEPSGVGTQMLRLAAGLRQRYRVLLCCPPSAGGAALLARATELGVETAALPDTAALLRLLRPAERPDIFHVHAGIGWEGLRAARHAREAGVPVVLRSEHLPYLLTDPEQQAAYRAMLPFVDRIICVSAGVCHSHQAAGVPGSKLRVIRNGIEAAPRPPVDGGELRRRLGLPPAARLILTVGRLTEQKGHAGLAAAAAGVIPAEPQAHFLWVGEGPCREALERCIRELGLSGKVRLLGRRADVSALLAAADLFVLPSNFEGLPLALLEAMSAGVPVIGTRVCGTEEVIEDGVSGRLVPPGDSHALAAAIRATLARPAEAAAMAATAREVVATCFSAERMVAETEALYRRELAARPGDERR